MISRCIFYFSILASHLKNGVFEIKSTGLSACTSAERLPKAMEQSCQHIVKEKIKGLFLRLNFRLIKKRDQKHFNSQKVIFFDWIKFSLKKLRIIC